MKNQVTELAGDIMSMCDSVNESLMNKTDDYKKINIYKWLGQNNWLSSSRNAFGVRSRTSRTG